MSIFEFIDFIVAIYCNAHRRRFTKSSDEAIWDKIAEE